MRQQHIENIGLKMYYCFLILIIECINHILRCLYIVCIDAYSLLNDILRLYFLVKEMIKKIEKK